MKKTCNGMYQLLEAGRLGMSLDCLWHPPKHRKTGGCLQLYQYWPCWTQRELCEPASPLNQPSCADCCVSSWWRLVAKWCTLDSRCLPVLGTNSIHNQQSQEEAQKEWWPVSFPKVLTSSFSYPTTSAATKTPVLCSDFLQIDLKILNIVLTIHVQCGWGFSGCYRWNRPQTTCSTETRDTAACVLTRQCLC